MRSIVLFLTLGIMVFSALPAAQAERPLRIATEIGYPPFVFLDKQNALTGFNVDIAKALCDEIKRDCEISAVPFDKIIAGILANDFDMAVAGMEKSPERLEQVNFTDSYFRSRSIFIEKPGTIASLTPEGKQGKRIGVQIGTVQELYLKQEYKDTATIVSYPTFKAIFEALQADRIDTALVDGLPTYFYLKSAGGDSLETLGDPVHSNILDGSSHIVVSKKFPELTQQLNNALATLRNNGTYGKINRRYFDFDIY